MNEQVTNISQALKRLTSEMQSMHEAIDALHTENANLRRNVERLQKRTAACASGWKSMRSPTRIQQQQHSSLQRKDESRSDSAHKILAKEERP